MTAAEQLHQAHQGMTPEAIAAHALVLAQALATASVHAEAQFALLLTVAQNHAQQHTDALVLRRRVVEARSALEGGRARDARRLLDRGIAEAAAPNPKTLISIKELEEGHLPPLPPDMFSPGAAPKEVAK